MPTQDGSGLRASIFSLFLAINRERTGKILFFGRVLALFGSFFAYFTKLFQYLIATFPCYFNNREEPRAEQGKPRRNRERTGKGEAPKVSTVMSKSGAEILRSVRFAHCGDSLRG
ncbi:MAG: hypothetical protein ABIO86_16795 [Sphingomonas sp.]